MRIVDVMNDPAGLAELRALGLRHVPVVARGADYVSGQNIEDVARFIGVHHTATPRLAAAELIRRWLAILDIAASYVSLIPSARLAERPIPGREGTIRDLAYHVFLVARAFIEAVEGVRADWIENSMQKPPAAIATGADVAAAGMHIREELRAFWERRGRIDATDTVQTFQGTQSLHWFLERSTWHCAQHTRQLADLLQRFGVVGYRPLDPALLENLPLPERIWE